MQYTDYTVSVVKDSPTVSGNGTAFKSRVAAGNSFKIKGDSVIYTVGSVDSDIAITLSTPFLGTTNVSAQYQITTDFTPNFGLAEVNVGDQDWPIHLTNETIRKIDQILAGLKAGVTFKGTWNAYTNITSLGEAIPAAVMTTYNLDGSVLVQGNTGHRYEVTVAGATNISGINLWEVGDSLVSNGSVWVKIPGPLHSVLDQVDSKMYTLANNLIQTQAVLAQYHAFA